MAKKTDIIKLQDSDKPITRRLPLTEQQLILIKDSQAALAQATNQANLILSGVVAAAGLNKVKISNVNYDDAYLELELA